MRIRWLAKALANLSAEAEYIARDNPSAASRTIQVIEDTVDLLRRHPALGRGGRVTGTRELVVAGRPYIVPYRVRTNEIEMLRVFHGARKWPSNL